MKKKCKEIDITDWRTVRPWVKDCVMRHKARYDFKALLIKHGVTKQEYYNALQTYEYEVFDKAIDSISQEACSRILERNLDLPPVTIRDMCDTTTGKQRQIGKESAMQQVFDHIAVGSCEEIFDSRMVAQQMSSIKGRGQLKGVNLLRSYVVRDNKAIRYAAVHGIRYDSACKYFVKLDIKKCYPSAKLEIFMELFEHDCGNEDIIWLWRELLSSHQVGDYTGFMIGALPSQWACQVMLSYLHRRAMELYTIRRDKKIKKAAHMVMFMDDMLLFGGSRKQLLAAVKDLTRYAKDKLGFEIKPNYEIKDLDIEPVDMMGYTIFRNGKVRMRARNFIHSRRLILRYKKARRLVYSQAQRLLSYKGYWIHSDTRVTEAKYNSHVIFQICANLISAHDKEENNAQSKVHGRTRSDCLFLTA